MEIQITWISDEEIFSDTMNFVGKSLWQMAFFGFKTNVNKSFEVKVSGLMLASIKLSKNASSVIIKSVKFDAIAQKMISFRSPTGFFTTEEMFKLRKPAKVNICLHFEKKIVKLFKWGKLFAVSWVIWRIFISLKFQSNWNSPYSIFKLFRVEKHAFFFVRRPVEKTKETFWIWPFGSFMSKSAGEEQKEKLPKKILLETKHDKSTDNDFLSYRKQQFACGMF